MLSDREAGWSSAAVSKVGLAHTVGVQGKLLDAGIIFGSINKIIKKK